MKGISKLNRSSNLNCLFNQLFPFSRSISLGVAVPEGEAHRHEPPIPHDEVKVDMKKNDAELKDEKKQPVPPAAVGEKQEPIKEVEQGHPVEVENKQDNMAEEAPKVPEVVVRKEGVDLGGGEVLSNQLQEKPVANAGKQQDDSLVKKVEKHDLVKDPLAGNVAAVDNQAVNNAAKAPDAAGKSKFCSCTTV